MPHARSNGSRRVFLDSFQTVPESRRRKIQEWTEGLDRLLSESHSEECDEEGFRNATANLIGPALYGDEVQQKYLELTTRLFREGCGAIRQGATGAVDSVLRDWETLMTSIGRRRGNPIEKQALDILSYECRTALHRCYSAVWSVLLTALRANYRMTDESVVFHQLWHFDRCQESDYGDEAYFHLFHGHVFALHPACGPVLLTRNGSELFSAWLREGSLASYHRVLHAMAVAVGYYGERHDIAALLRRKDSVIDTCGDIVALEEQEVGRRSGRRPAGNRDIDED